MSIVSVEEQFQPSRFLIITNLSDPSVPPDISTTRILISDQRVNTINLISVEKGPQGDQGLIGPQGPPGKDGVLFDILPVSSGGTNNSSFLSGYIIAYDGSKLASTSYTISDILSQSSSSNTITGIIAGTGLTRTILNNSEVTIDVNLGEGLEIINNQIVVDSSIARTAELSLGSIQGTVPISKGGTNNSIYSANKLVYYDGNKITSFPLNTGAIVVSGSKINIIAGSGLVGGGELSLPTGSIVLSIPSSADIFVEENSLSLSTTGVAGTYSKVTTDNKGRVIHGESLSLLDIVDILGYVPWHSGNDGSGSFLDADLLDGQHGSFYRDGTNLTGVISQNVLPNLHPTTKTGTKFVINTKGLVEAAFSADTNDIISSLGYTPLNASEDATKQGSLNLIGSLITSAGDVSFYDNLPLFGTNREDILPSEPRGFTFNYGGIFSNRTGILAYYPGDNQLKLITNVYGSGTDIDGDGDSNYQDDINGGNAESIYILQNLQGDSRTILFREIADSLYVTTNTSQDIIGLKRFLSETQFYKKIRILDDGQPPSAPPIDVGNNNIKINNLNSDLLDDQHGSYYRNAANLTGSFSYNSVSFDHIQGEYRHIAKFNDPSDPSQTIDSSNLIQKSDGDIQTDNNINFIVGSNNLFSSENNIVVGTSNTGVDLEESLIVGSNNSVSGISSFAAGRDIKIDANYSVAVNRGSIVTSNNSFAAGSYGIASNENQFAFGAFKTLLNGETIEHGQYSTIAAYLRGTETQGSWVSLSPIIQLPKDKTIAYNIELLINKGLSSGVAYFSFSSGIINNATFRDPSNITQIINKTTVPNSGNKKELYNNSQLRRHYHFWKYRPSMNEPQTSVVQYINCENIPIKSNTLDLRHIKSHYFYNPEQVSVTGFFEKDNRGLLVLDVNKPRYSGVFIQNLSSPNIRINTRDSEAVLDSLVDINLINHSQYFFPSGRYRVLSSNDDGLFIEAYKWKAVKITENNITKIKILNTFDYDLQTSFVLSGTISNNIISLVSIYNNFNYKISDVVKTNANIKLIHNNNAYNRVVQSINNNLITINHPIFSTGNNPTAINDNIQVIFDEYSYNIFKFCDSLVINNQNVSIKGGKTYTNARFFPDDRFNFVQDSGAGTFQNPAIAQISGFHNSGIFVENDPYNNLSFSIEIDQTLNNVQDGEIVDARPVFSNNTGYLELYKKSNFECNYSAYLSNLNLRRGVYVRELGDNTNKISIFDENNTPVNFISNPPIFGFASGYGSDNNQFFDIEKVDNAYFLKTKKSFDYEENNLIPIKVFANSFISGIADYYEQYLYISIDNVKEKPYILKSFEPTGVATDNLFFLDLSGVFIDQDFNDNFDVTANVRGLNTLPRWLYLNTNQLCLSGVPDICDVGSYSIDIKATDSSQLSSIVNIIISVSGNTPSYLEGSSYNTKSILNTQNIYLTKTNIDENTPSGTVIGEIKHFGGYNPYAKFFTAQNNFSGIFTHNSDLIRQCLPNIVAYSGFSISGTPEFLDVDSFVLTKFPDPWYPSSGIVKNVYKPSVFSGTPCWNDKIVLNNTSLDHSISILFTGQKLPDDMHTVFDERLRIKNIDDYSAVIGLYLIQETSLDLILTENNDPITYEKSLIEENYFLVDEENQNILFSDHEKLSKLKYSDALLPDNVIWSNKNYYASIVDENFDSINLSDTEFLDSFISEQSNNTEIIYDNLYSGIPVRIRRSIHELLGNNLVDSIVYPLHSLTKPKEYVKYVVSNIDYPRLTAELYNPKDNWTFSDLLNNSNLYLHDVGTEDNAHFVTEQRFSQYENEYGLLLTENGFDGLISDTKTDHGSRLELSTRYELLDQINAYPDNGRLVSESFFDDSFLCENNDRLVHDYALSCQNAYLNILFPGLRNYVSINYPKNRSYSSHRLKASNFFHNILCEDHQVLVSENNEYITKDNPPIGLYEDVLENISSVLEFSEPDFYYTWGKLIPYPMYTDEYVVRLNSTHPHSGTRSGIINYNGELPSSGNYFPHSFYEHFFNRQSGYCSEIYSSGGLIGFAGKENVSYAKKYVTGVVEFYTDFTSQFIDLYSSKNIHKDNRTEDYIHLYGINTVVPSALMPRYGLYNDYEILSSNGIRLENYLLMPPDLVVQHTGLAVLNIDRNHRQDITNNSLINDIAIKFLDIKNSNQNRLPKNNIFDIKHISGHRIYVDDNKNYTLKSSSYPDYFDHEISSKYITNGIQFLGSLFHNNTNIYDVRESITKINHVYDNIYFYFDKTNNILAFSIPKNTIRLFDRIQVNNFVPATTDMDWHPAEIDTVGFTVLPENFVSGPETASTNKYFVLLESSAPQASNYSDKLIFNTDLFPANTFGSCSINNLLPNRFDEGYVLNHVGGSGYNYLSYTSGYSFSGVIPRLNNVLSSDQILNDNRIGFASIISTGSLSLLSGVKSVRFASSSSDIGYSETYLVSRSGFKNNEFLNSGISGVGSISHPYSILVRNTGTPYTSRFLEFLYLGHNSNTIRLSGSCITSGTNELKITKITLEDANEIERLKKLNIISGVAPLISTGTAGSSGNIYYEINIKRFDQIQIKLDSSFNTYQNTLYLNVSANEANPYPLIFDHNIPINTGNVFYPSYTNIPSNLFYVLPTIHTDSKYCNSSVLYRKNKEIFYNGNIVSLYNFDSIKSFLNKNDNFKILTLNNSVVQNGSGALFLEKINSSQDYFSITGITKQGNFSIPSSIYPYASSGLLENTTRQSDTLGISPSIFLNNSGQLSFVGYHSGSFEALLDNNISIQSHGGSTSYWPQNTEGVLIPPPLTGLYSISDNTFSCSSGRLCVVITGYKNTNFNSMSFTKDYYFDFSDGFSVANGVYRIKDKLSQTVFSIDVPYNNTYFSKSGIVHIIEGKYNIKTNLNPNSGNTFIINQPTTTLSLPNFRLDKFDNNTKKWTHTYNLSKTIDINNIAFKFNIANTGYDSSIIKNNFNKIKISNISKISDIETTPQFTSIPQNGGIEAYTDETSVLLRIQTSGGFPEMVDRLTNTPRISISGSASYALRKGSLSQNLWGYVSNSGWNTVLEIVPFGQTGVFPMVLSAKDETGTDVFPFSLILKNRPVISPILSTGYAFAVDNFWKMSFDVDGIDLLSNNPGNQGMSITNAPTEHYSFLRLSDSIFTVSGTGIMSTGIYTPVISIIKLNSSDILASGSGTLSVVNSLNDRPQYTPQINKFKLEKYVDITKSKNIFYFIPTYESSPDGLIPSLNGGIYFDSIVDSNTFDSSINRYTIEFLPRNTGAANYLSDSVYAPNRSFNFTVKQPIYTNGSPSYLSYTSNNYIQNITFYKPIVINTSYINTIPVFKINRPWSLQFVVDEGLTKHKSNTPPRVSLFNTPGLGTLNYQYLNYSLSYQYDNTQKYWIVTAAGKPDQYGNYVSNTGLYTVDIFVDDHYASYAKAQMSFIYTSFNKIDYILPNIYATPNNEFFSNADVYGPFDFNEPIIEFDGENTVNFNYGSSYKKYNRKFNIWEIAFTGNKLIDKWDGRIVLNTNQVPESENGPTITIQAKGIATDKITAVAKVELLELKNTNSDILLEILPIKITGISGGDEAEWTPESGIEVNQGSKGWKLAFKTIRGLESPSHPPTILLEDMPTFCTGYDPRLDPNYSLDNPTQNLQNSCLIEGPTFSDSDNSWSFLFSGLPSCTLEGPYGFSITAIDTDLTLSNPYIEPSDRVDTLFNYKAIEEDHPGPSVLAIEEEGVTNTIIKPKCNSQYYLQLKFGPSIRSECPSPTGLTGFYFSGGLPSGLTYSYTYPAFSQTNTFNSPIYNNLGSGVVTIQGYAEEFAPAGSDDYLEEFGIVAVDARNKTGIYILNFAQTIDINEPDIGLRVFFDNSKPVFSPNTGLKPLEVSSNIDTYRPEAAAYNLVCRTILPNNKCPASGIIYSGLPDTDNYMILMPSGSNALGISSGDFIYIDVNNPSINDKYLVQRSNGVIPFSSFPSGRLYITTNSPFSQRTGTAVVVVEKFQNLELDDMSELFFGAYTSKCVLGNGLLDRDRSPNPTNAKIGIRGFIVPSLSGYLSPTGFWNVNDIRLTGLNMQLLSNTNYITEIPYIDCWQTGYLRISGILLPKIYTEITDPPPGASAPFTSNGSSFVLNTRLAYGDTEIERSINANRRGGKTAYYTFTNLVNNSTDLAGSVSISTTNQQAIVLNGSTLESSCRGSGAVFRFSIRSSGDIFPNFLYNSIPASQTGNYYWVHKASTVLSSPVLQNTFPAVIPCEPNNINIISGEIINFNNLAPDYGINGFAYGGYVAHSGTQNDNWSSRNYLPIISGLIIKTINKDAIVLNSFYNHVNKRLSIPGTINKVSPNNLIRITISKQGINDLTLIDSINTGLLSTDFSNDVNTLYILKDYGNESFNAICDIKFVSLINQIDTQNHVLNIRHNNLAVSTGSIIIIDSNEKSSSLNTIGINNAFSVVEKTTTGLSISGYGNQPSILYNNFNSGDYIDLYEHIEDNIKIMPYNIRSDEDSRYDFVISGRANILHGFYYYRILTKENNSAPIFTSLIPKLYFRDIPLIVSKPIKIIDSSVNWTGSSWTIVLQIKHGSLPALSERIDVQIDLDQNGNYSYCGFDRFPAGVISDSYDSNTEITTVSLSSNTRGPWSNINETSFNLKVSDSTGFDIVTITKS